MRCPLRSFQSMPEWELGKAQREFFERFSLRVACMGADCAWWDGDGKAGACILHSIAEGLHRLADKETP